MPYQSLVGFLISLAAILAVPFAVQAQANGHERQLIARLGNETIYEDDLLPSIEGKLLQLKNQEYELKIAALTDLVNRRLLEREAKSKGVSVEEFLQQTVDRNLPSWNVSELDGYYLARRDSFKKPFEEVRPQVEKAFLQARRAQARQDYVDQLRQKASLTVLLTRPQPEAMVDPSRLRGDPTAPVTVWEFADFQCPYSQSIQPVLREILIKYKRGVRLGFRDFPLSEIHPQARAAAEAARCAGEQGKFWQYHDLLFSQHARLDPDALVEHARAVGLDITSFSACLGSGKFDGQIDNDMSWGRAFGVTGTPTTIINGVAVLGPQPKSVYERIIESEVAKANLNESMP